VARVSALQGRGTFPARAGAAAAPLRQSVSGAYHVSVKSHCGSGVVGGVLPLDVSVIVLHAAMGM
jgi:hypothetical protein